MKRKYNISSSQLTCPNCGNAFPIPRYGGRSRRVNHIKDLWCPYCKGITKMVENKREIFTMSGDLLVW